jgi:hypothetical protein
VVRIGFPEPEPEPEPERPESTLEEEEPDDCSRLGRGRMGLLDRPVLVHAARGGM